MKRILVLGAGKSATTLIDYLIIHAKQYNWHIVVADRNLTLAQEKIESRQNAEAIELDITNETARAAEIKAADFVISMLPPFLHIHVARDCVTNGTDLVTASYVKKEILELHKAAEDADVLLMNELGADPGIDHMSAMQLIENIRREGGTVTSFQSYCGGLIAPESDTNPWHYKVAWNPWNIVRAGATGADFLMNGKEYHRTYENLYKESNIVEVPGYGKLAAYANRDSLKYRDDYKLDNAHTVLRATLRHPDFMKGWAAVIALGLTSDTNQFDVSGMSRKEWFLKSTEHISGNNLEDKLKTVGGNDLVLHLFRNLGLDADEQIDLSGEQIVGKVMQSIIVKEWVLMPEDKDLLVFHHDIEYELDGDSHQVESTMLVKGENQTDTAMSKCVGLPMAIFTKLYLTGQIKNLKGVHIPVDPIVYEPVLAELVKHGIEFTEQ